MGNHFDPGQAWACAVEANTKMRNSPIEVLSNTFQRKCICAPDQMKIEAVEVEVLRVDEFSLSYRWDGRAPVRCQMYEGHVHWTLEAERLSK